MQQQFTVPQFIEVEAKIIGPISARQFVILFLALGVTYVWYELFNFVIFVVLAFVTMGAGAILGFAKISGQPMHYFLLNFIQTRRRPALRVWRRPVREEHIEGTTVDSTVPMVVKRVASGSHVTEASLVVDTRGVFRGVELEEQQDYNNHTTPSSTA